MVKVLLSERSLYVHKYNLLLFFFALMSFLLIAPCIEELLTSGGGLLVFSKGDCQTVPALQDFCLYRDTPDHLIPLQNCHKHNNSLEFHCKVRTSMVVGNMTQAL